MADDIVSQAVSEETDSTIATQKKETNEHVIYCGPAVPTYGLRQYQTFIGGFPKNVEAAIKECLAVSGLMVPVIELAKARIAIETKGSSESVLYEQVEQHFRKE